MKNLFVIVLMLFAVVGCQKEPVQPPVEEPTTGNFSFEIFYDGEPVSGAYIGITKDNPADENNLFLIIKPTDENGKVKFEELEPGEYFWQIKFPNEQKYWNIGGNPPAFIDLALGSYKIKAGGNLGGPVFINP